MGNGKVKEKYCFIVKQPDGRLFSYFADEFFIEKEVMIKFTDKQTGRTFIVSKENVLIEDRGGANHA